MARPKGSKNKIKVSRETIVPTVPTVPTDGQYKIALKCLGRNYHSEGATFEDAISKIKISGGARALSVLTVEKDGVKKEKILNGAHTNGLFGQGSPTMRAIHFKQVRAFCDV